jgi:hypothetical protein
MQALKFIHGFDMTYRSSDERVIGHGPPWRYVFTLEEVLTEFKAWHERCTAFDGDPVGWPTEQRRVGEAAVRREREQA